MRKVDPTVVCIAVGDNDMDWNRTVLESIGDRIDYLAIHHYYTAEQTRNDPLNLMARPHFYDRFYGQVRKLIKDLKLNRDIKLAINEWGLDLPAARQYSIESALYAARLMNVFERNNDLIEMTSVSDLINGWPGGIIQASRHDVFVTPIYLVNQLYARNLGSARLGTTVESPDFDSSLEGMNVPFLDATASRSAETNVMFLKMVNSHYRAPLRVSLTLTNAAPNIAELFTISAESLTAVNGFNTPKAVQIRESSVSPGTIMRFELPKHSVAVLKVELARD
jgi:alpha-N-arabinofuranosidase